MMMMMMNENLMWGEKNTSQYTHINTHTRFYIQEKNGPEKNTVLNNVCVCVCRGGIYTWLNRWLLVDAVCVFSNETHTHTHKIHQKKKKKIYIRRLKLVLCVCVCVFCLVLFG